MLLAEHHLRTSCDSGGGGDEERLFLPPGARDSRDRAHSSVPLVLTTLVNAQLGSQGERPAGPRALLMALPSSLPPLSLLKPAAGTPPPTKPTHGARIALSRTPSGN